MGKHEMLDQEMGDQEIGEEHIKDEHADYDEDDDSNYNDDVHSDDSVNDDGIQSPSLASIHDELETQESNFDNTLGDSKKIDLNVSIYLGPIVPIDGRETEIDLSKSNNDDTRE